MRVSLALQQRVLFFGSDHFAVHSLSKLIVDKQAPSHANSVTDLQASRFLPFSQRQLLFRTHNNGIYLTR